MKLQLLSDLHLETEAFTPEPAPGADALVLAGDIDSTWRGYERFIGWPVPVLVVLGNHEFDGRDVDEALGDFRHQCGQWGFTLLERDARLLPRPTGGTLRVLGTTRWCDFEVLGAAGRARAERAASHWLRRMDSRRGGQPLDAAAVRGLALECRRWLQAELERHAPRQTLPDGSSRPAWDSTLVITHFAPSLRSADPRYGAQPGTASFCNADDDLLPRADLWLHGHLHCRHDYAVPRPGRAPTRVVCNARGLMRKGEPDGHGGAAPHAATACVLA